MKPFSNAKAFILFGVGPIFGRTFPFCFVCSHGGLHTWKDHSPANQVLRTHDNREPSPARWQCWSQMKDVSLCLKKICTSKIKTSSFSSGTSSGEGSPLVSGKVRLFCHRGIFSPIAKQPLMAANAQPLIQFQTRTPQLAWFLCASIVVPLRDEALTRDEH